LQSTAPLPVQAPSPDALRTSPQQAASHAATPIRASLSPTPVTPVRQPKPASSNELQSTAMPTSTSDVVVYLPSVSFNFTRSAGAFLIFLVFHLFFLA
jgi:hypothetical protein